MRRIGILAGMGVLLCGTVLLVRTPGRAGSAAGAPGRPDNPVLVELFTSEGCSDCPPADRLLSQLQARQPVPGARVIALEEHVDYWNRLGWSDPFSSKTWSSRQSAYSTAFHLDQVYTPQMIVDGRTEFIGSEEDRAVAAIAQAVRAPKTPIRLDLTTPPPVGSRRPAPSVHVTFQSPASPSEGMADVLMAVCQDNLRSRVSAGENAGRTLDHAAVARSLQVIGQVRPGRRFSAEQEVVLDPGWERGGLRVVVWVQDPRSRRVLGVASENITKP